jgi:two-component system KDP operon response regulator KdpE
VDDEPTIVELLQDVLSVEGFVVDAAPNAAGAIDLIRENIYDAAILDFNLPDMNGVMLHRQIRQMDDELADHALFMSGLVQTDENLGYYESFGAGFLPKPFHVGDVVRAVRRMIESDGPAAG